MVKPKDMETWFFLKEEHLKFIGKHIPLLFTSSSFENQKKCDSPSVILKVMSNSLGHV